MLQIISGIFVVIVFFVMLNWDNILNAIYRANILPAELQQKVHELKLWNKLGFSCYQLSTVTDTLVNAWQMFFYTTFCNISIAFIASVLAASKLISAFLTPLFGSISDHLYETKFGRRFGRRKSMLLIAIPWKVATFPLYWIPDMPIWYYVTLLLLTSFVNPLATVSQGTFAAEMARTPSEKAQLAGMNQVGAAIAGMFVSILVWFGCYNAIMTSPGIIEFMDPRVNKGMALHKYSERNNIPIDEIMAFGDMDNDKEMLKEAGWGVCLINGSDASKAMADCITEYPCTEDGMGRWLETYVLDGSVKLGR